MFVSLSRSPNLFSLGGMVILFESIDRPQSFLAPCKSFTSSFGQPAHSYAPLLASPACRGGILAPAAWQKSPKNTESNVFRRRKKPLNPVVSTIDNSRHATIKMHVACQSERFTLCDTLLFQQAFPETKRSIAVGGVVFVFGIEAG